MSDHAFLTVEVPADPSKPQSNPFKRFTSRLRNLSTSSLQDILHHTSRPSMSSISASNLATLDGPSVTPPSSSRQSRLCTSDPAPLDAPNEKLRKKVSKHLLSLPRLPVASQNSPSGLYASLYDEIENDWTSASKREAALRASGLVPALPRPGRDLHGYRVPLSELETRHDEKYTVEVILPNSESSPEDGEYEDSEAKRIREDWMRRNLERGCETRVEAQTYSDDEGAYHDALEGGTPTSVPRPAAK